MMETTVEKHHLPYLQDFELSSDLHKISFLSENNN